MKKKVLFSATVDSHILHFHVPYLKLFKEKGYEVHVATNGNEKIPYCDKKHIISFERSPYKLNNLKAIKQLKKIIDEENFEIIHTHTPMGSVVTRLASIKARKKDTRVIYTAHGFHFYKGASKLNWLLFYPVEKILSRYTDCLITINKEDYELAKNKFKKCKQIEYVPGVGIDEEKFNFKMTTKEKNDLRKSLGLKKDDFVLIYPAEISKRKRQIWLINVVKNLLIEHRNIHLLLPGKDSLNGECQKLVRELNLTSQIHFLGYRKDIPKLLSISNLSLSSANQEGLPVNIMEAMYAGLPIVASDCRGNRDLVKDHINGYLVAIDDKEKYEDSIKKIYNSNELNTKFSDESRYIIKEYLLDKIMLDMKKIYFDLGENMKRKILIIPSCTDYNRGDQALVLETKRIIDKIYVNNECYMMSSGETEQCEKMGVKVFKDILKHPSRFGKKNNNMKYSIYLKLKWGCVAVIDYIISQLLLFKVSRKLILPLLNNGTKLSIKLFEEADAVFVKGGGFLHDYSKGLIGIYTMYFQLYHIKLALKMGKKVYIMPNSFGPFKNKISSEMIKKVLKQCRIVTARESISSSKNSNGLSTDIDLYPDLGFFLDKSESQYDVEKLFKKCGINAKKDKIVAITVRPYRFYSYDNPEEKYLEYKKSFVKFINYLTKKDYKVILVVHTRAENDHENDDKCIDEILKMIIDKKNVVKIKDDNMNCYDIKKLYGYCKYIIGTRFHSVIFSVQQSIPCIAITYGGNKGDGIMKDMDMSEYAIKIGDLDCNILIDLFEKMVKNEKLIIDKIGKYIEYANAKYTEMVEIIRNDLKK